MKTGGRTLGPVLALGFALAGVPAVAALTANSMAQSDAEPGTSRGEVVLTKLSPPVYPQIARTAHVTGDVELGLEEIDMLFLVGEHLGKEVAADIVLGLLAIGHRRAVHCDRLDLEVEVGPEDLLDALADLQ